VRVVDADVGHVLDALGDPGARQVTWQTALGRQEAGGRRHCNHTHTSIHPWLLTGIER